MKIKRKSLYYVKLPGRAILQKAKVLNFTDVDIQFEYRVDLRTTVIESFKLADVKMFEKTYGNL